jgi:RHS repeat-associated protein
VNRTEYYYLGNLLIWKKNFRNGVLTQQRQYTYDGNLLVQERDGANPNHVVNEYIYGQGLPGGIGGLLRLNQGGAAYSYLFDGKGNVTALLNGSTGQVARTYQYDPFGVPMGGSGSINQPMRFSTKSYDDQTGLSYYGYRFYAPALGRWLTRDPLGEEGGINQYGFTDSVRKPFSGTNLYAFCDNNPVNRIDSDGRLWQEMMWEAIKHYIAEKALDKLIPDPFEKQREELEKEYSRQMKLENWFNCLFNCYSKYCVGSPERYRCAHDCDFFLQ